MAKRSSLKVNEIKPKVVPRYRYEVFIEIETSEKLSFAECIDVYAHSVDLASDDLVFVDDAGDTIACFKTWCYFVRREKEGELVGSEMLPKMPIDPPGAID